MSGMQPGNDVEEVAGRRRPAVESKSLRCQLTPRHPLAREENRTECEGPADPRECAMQRRPSESKPFLEHIEFPEDVVARELHRRAAQKQNGGVQKDDGWQKDGMPVPDLFVR